MIREKVIDKLAKLMRHRDSAREIGSEHEAMAFAETIQRLMLEHEIEISEVKFVDSDPLDDVVGTQTFFYSEHDLPIRRVRQWQWTLAKAVARAHFCDLLVPGDQLRPYVTFVGKPPNRAVSAYMFEVLARTAVNLAGIKYLEEWRVEQRSGDVRRLRGFKASFLDAFADRIWRRYDDLNRQQQKTSELVLRSAALATKDYMSGFSPRKGKRPSSVGEDNEIGRIDGTNAANSVPLRANAVGAREVRRLKK